MRILMIAPQPYFQFRGTPFSIRERLRALTHLGHTVDLITYAIGQRVELPGVRVFRSPPLPPIRSVPIGPSWIKFPLDFLLALRVVAALPQVGRVDVVDSHEEGGIIGVVVAMLLGVPHIYDMHSSLPQQLENYRFTKPRSLVTLARRTEAWIVRHSAAVIVVCPWLERVVRKIDPEKRVFLIENPPVCEPPGPDVVTSARVLRTSLGVKGRDVVLYTGTFEVNQGLDLLMEAVPQVLARHPRAMFVLVGGEPGQVAEFHSRAERMRLGDHVRLTGQRPPDEMPAFMELASVLVSPRLVGQNTPLKIYSYLQSGKPIVATDLATHTQVLSSDTAVLVPAEPTALASGILRVLGDADLAARLGSNGRSLVEQRYSWPRFVEATTELCAFLEGRNDGMME
ncbi:glycosyltransferase family 4 protein [Candidatus Fermentibacteria bacterium]|nr:glycosyltransferase family 4 protein [Candidatus Fermentibacteria bacterium]